MSLDAAPLEPGLRRRLFLRSLVLQSCWSFERMQGLGFAYCLEPWLERCYAEAQRRREALARHLSYFNTHPYMAPLVVGMVCALEEEAAAAPAEERPAKLARIGALKTAAGGALAGIGDALFWGALRPFCAALALVAGLLAWRAGLPRAVPWMAAAYLAAYNGPALALRWSGVGWGYQWKEQFAERLGGYPWQAWIQRLRQAGGALALALLALMLTSRELSSAERRVGAVMIPAYFAALRLWPAAANPYRLYAVTAVGGFLAAAAGWG